MNKQQIEEQLLHWFPALGELPRTLFDEVLSKSPHKEFAVDTVLFDEGHVCTIFPLVLSGTIRVVKRGARGRELVLYRVRPGESCVLSTTCLLGQAAFSAAGVVEKAVTLLAMPAELFNRLVREGEPFRRYLFELLSTRVTNLMEVIDEVAFRRLDERLAGLLVADGNTVHASHQDIADQLGSTREMISRLLGNFEDKRWVILKRERIEILDRAALLQATGRQV